MGENNSTGYAQNILFEDMVYASTANVARIKTWQGGKGAVSNITFRNVRFEAVEYPILIDQYYCPSSQHPNPCSNYTETVNISQITFEDFYGFQTNGHCGEFKCSDSIPCTDIVLKNVTIKPQEDGAENQWDCWQVMDGRADRVEPPIETQGNCQWFTS